MSTRRHWITQFGSAAALAVRRPNAHAEQPGIVIDPKPQFEISPHLYMQFMEPLGTTDSSVEASWDYTANDWRADFVSTVSDLKPGMIRFGGNFSRYYKWREGVGPVVNRPLTRNYDWGGKETNRVGTHEFVDFCRRVGADPMYCVNFQSDGIDFFRHTPEGDRSGTPEEASEWVSYANDPDNKQRHANGSKQPYNIKVWQIGNETSYVPNAFTKEQAIAHTITFAKAMRERDRSIRLIGWGDKGRGSQELWAGDMLRYAGEHLNYVAIHMMGQSPRRPDTVLTGKLYEEDPQRAWAELLEFSNNVETRIGELESVIDDAKSKVGIAVTEGHLSLKPHNTNGLLFEWLSAVYHARSLNIYQRHGARVRIATAADFQGTRWTVMAVGVPVPKGKSFLSPAGSVMRLYARHNGRHGVSTTGPSDLDIAASRTEGKLYLHVANLQYAKAVEATLSVRGMAITGGRMHTIAPRHPREYVNQDRPDIFRPQESVLEISNPVRVRFESASVTAVELDVISSSVEGGATEE